MDSLQEILMAVDSKPRVGVAGTGDFGLGIARCLDSAGYQVTVGSRHPEERTTALSVTGESALRLASLHDCCRSSDVIFLAIHAQHFEETIGECALEESLVGKILVDVSNRDSNKSNLSNTERLASILPQCRVVKAFNTVPALAFDHFSGVDRTRVNVFVAGDDRGARFLVADIARCLGFPVTDFGGIKNSRHLEQQTSRTFPNCRFPLAVTLVVLLVVGVYIYWQNYIQSHSRSLDQAFLLVFNKVICVSAITMLALTYLPGQLAAILQVYHGTKHRRFPRCLDLWLKRRKQLGLLTFALAALHTAMSTILMTPNYMTSWYHKSSVHIDLGNTSAARLSLGYMTAYGESACLVGLLALGLMLVLAVTSLPSVSGSLNWSEWVCVQSRLGYLVLLLSVLHVLIVVKFWKGYSLWSSAFWLSRKTLSAILPMVVLLLKLVFSVPPLSGYLWRIRRGWERRPRKQRGECCVPELKRYSTIEMESVETI